MNVCLISREYPPFFGGGIGAYTVRWSRALAGAGHRVVVVTVSEDGKERRERDGAVEVVRLPFIKGSGQTGDWSGPHPLIATPEKVAAFRTFSPVAVFALQVAEALPRLVGEFGIEVVEAPDTGGLAWFALNARRTGAVWREGGPAFVTCCHSPTEWIAQWNRTPLRGRKDWELAWMERDGAEWSDGLVAPSGAMAGWVEEHWGVRGVEVIPYALGELEGVARARLEEHRPAEEPASCGTGGTILFAGRLEPRKGVDTLLEAFARTEGLTLDLVGEDMPDPDGGLHGARLIAAMPGAARGRVRVHGRMEPAHVAAMRARAGVVVVPSPMDNFPNTCMEAMAEGRVVVAARAGGMAEMIRDGVDGILFEAGDSGGCADALTRAAGLSAEHAGEMGRSAAGRMVEMCGNAVVAERRVAHYQRAIEVRKRERRAIRGGSFVVVKRSGATREQIRRLIEAARQSGTAFAHGWSRGGDGAGGGVRVFSTPRAETLGMAAREIGALVVERKAARGLTREMSGCEAATALAGAGKLGVVVPDVVVDDAPERGRIERMLLALRGG